MKRSEPVRAVVQFAVTGTCALLLLGFLAVTLLRNTGKSEAIRDARQTTRLAGGGGGAPAIPPAAQAGGRRGGGARHHARARARRPPRDRRDGQAAAALGAAGADRPGEDLEPRREDHLLRQARADRVGLQARRGRAQGAPNRHRRRRGERPLAPREPLRAAGEEAARGLPRGTQPAGPPAPVRGIPALQLDLGERHAALEAVPARADRRAGAARACADPAGVVARAPPSARPARARGPAAAGDRRLRAGAAADRPRPPRRCRAEARRPRVRAGGGRRGAAAWLARAP